MASLAELFEARSSTLLDRLRSRPDPAAATTATAEFLDALRVDYLAQDRLPASAIRLAPPLIGIVKESLRLAAAGTKPRALAVHSRRPSPPTRRTLRDYGMVAVAAGLALLLLTVLILAGELLASLILLLLAGAGGAALFGFPGQGSMAEPADQPAATTEIRPEAWADAVHTALQGCDRVMAQAEETARADRLNGATLAGNPELLDLLQDLLEAGRARDGAFALQKIEARVPRLLKKEGISIVSFDGGNEGLFDFERSLRPSDPQSRTIRPALVQGERCLKAGRAERPGEDQTP